MKNIFKILEVNTCHISKQAGVIFDSPADFETKQPYMKSDFGWIFLVPEVGNMEMVEGVGCEGFTRCIKLAQDSGCDYLLIDNLLGYVDALPIYEWE